MRNLLCMGALASAILLSTTNLQAAVPVRYANGAAAVASNTQLAAYRRGYYRGYGGYYGRPYYAGRYSGYYGRPSYGYGGYYGRPYGYGYGYGPSYYRGYGPGGVAGATVRTLVR